MSCGTRGSSPSCVVVNFHHARGPEVEHWIGDEGESPLEIEPQPEYIQVLPFLALPDGAHSVEEDFSYFTLNDEQQTTLFGISCTRQLDSKELVDRPADVTRSTVQKAVVVIASDPTLFFGHLKQQLSAVTAAWFAQKNFTDMEIIRRFQESLQINLEIDQARDQYVGLPLRELIFDFKYQTLVLFKCMLLQPKMLFFGGRCEKLCMIQFSLLSLIPGLLKNLCDCSDPEMNKYESSLTKPSSVKTSDRQSLLTFMGLPLQIFGKGSLFGPYTPLQQLDILADVGTKSYMVGSTNSLLLQQRDRYSDILINLDERTVNITSSSLRSALVLSAADRRWIDALVNAVQDSWDESDPSRTKTMGFVGSDDYIRLQFEEYLLSLVSSVKYHIFLEKHAGSDMNVFLPDVEGDPAHDYNMDWVDAWKKTENFRIFQKFTDSELFDLVPPRHVMAGGLTFDDVQRRISQQVQELHLDERMSSGKEALARTWASSRSNFSAAITNLSKNVEQFRERRKVAGEASEATSPSVSTAPTSPTVGAQAPGVLSSWAAWAAEKRQKAFSGATSPAPEQQSSASSSIIESEKAEKTQSGIFSLKRWSKSPSLETQSKRVSSSSEIVRETVWEDTPSGPEKIRPAPIEIRNLDEERPMPVDPNAPPEFVTSPPFVLPKALTPKGDKEQLPENPNTPRIIELDRIEDKELPAEPTPGLDDQGEKEILDESRQTQEFRASEQREAEPVSVHQEEKETSTESAANQAPEKELPPEPTSTESSKVDTHEEKQTPPEPTVFASPKSAHRPITPEHPLEPAPKSTTMEESTKAKQEPAIPSTKAENVDPKTPISPTRTGLPRPKALSPTKRFPVATSKEIPGSPSKQRPDSPSKLPPGSPSKQAPGSSARMPSTPSPQKSAFAARRAMFEQQK